MTEKTPEKERVTIYLTREVHTALKIEAAERRMAMGDVISEALQTRARLISHAETEPSSR